MQALSFKNLTKTYANGVEALKGIDLTIEQGDLFALLGPNGAGKSTAIGIVTTLVNKTCGEIHVFGHNLDKHPGQAKACIGLVPQEFNFNIFETVEQIIINQGGYYGVPRKIAKQRTRTYLKKLDLLGKMNTKARELSGGMKRRLMIARALVHQPKLLILDEPTAGVDIEIRQIMQAFIREMNQQGTTIILTSHHLEEVENLCKNIAILNEGIIIENSPIKELLTQLKVEKFELNLANSINEVPPLTQFNPILLDHNTLQVSLNKEQPMNLLFKELNRHNITVTSLRNKMNRLEELFIDLVSTTKKSSAHE